MVIGPFHKKKYKKWFANEYKISKKIHNVIHYIKLFNIVFLSRVFEGSYKLLC